MKLPTTTPTRILFIGNSYTGRNNLPELVTALAASASPSRMVETLAILANGMPLRAHWNKGASAEAIRDGRWDYVVLQEQSTLPWKSPARMHDTVRQFNEVITAAGARTVLYLTWARLDTPERQQDITEAYTSIGRELGALIAPVGLAWETVRRDHPNIKLHEDDKSHPTLAGSHLAACVFHATLFDESPLGLAVPPKLDADIATALQAAAWEAVRHR